MSFKKTLINDPLIPVPSSKSLSPDQALKLCGDSNWYQIRLTLILTLQSTIIAFILQGQSFLFLSPQFQCTNTQGEKYLCEETESCKEQDPTIAPGSYNSLVVHFGLYCDKAYLKSLAQTIFFLISNIATLVFSFLADYKGRKFTILMLYCIGSLPLIVASFAWDWNVFMTFLIIAGIGINPFTSLCFVILSESAGEKYRQNSSVALMLTWALGQLIFVPIAYYFPSWDVLLLYWIAIPLTVQIVAYVWVYESPKFLIMKQRFQEAKSVLLKIAKTNKKEIEEFSFEDENKSNLAASANNINRSDISNEGERKEDAATKIRIYTYWDILRNRSQLKITVILCFAYFATYLTYYGGIFAMQEVGFNIYITALLTNCAELIAYLVSNPVIRFVSRKKSFPMFYVLLTVSCFMFLFTTNKKIYLVLAVFTKFFVSINFSIIYVYTAELYPTVVRSLGLGFTTFVGKFGCALAPILISSCQFSLGVHPMVSFGCFCLISSILTWFLRETFKKDLEDEIPEEKEKRRKEKEVNYSNLENILEAPPEIIKNDSRKSGPYSTSQDSNE